MVAEKWPELEEVLSTEELAFCAVQHLLGLRWEGTSRLQDLIVHEREGEVMQVSVVQRESKTDNRPCRRNLRLQGRFKRYVENFLAGRKEVKGPVFEVPYKKILAGLAEVGITTHAMRRGYVHAVDDMQVDDETLQRLTGHRRYKNVETYLGLERAAQRRERGVDAGEVQRRLQEKVG